MSPTVKPGCYTVYDTYGICKVNEIKKLSFVKGEAPKEYYVLSPLNSGTSTYYVPSDSETVLSKFRPPLTKSEIDRLLSVPSENKLVWTDNRQERNEKFQKILSKGITSELLELIRCLLKRKAQLSEKGKKLSSTDESFLGAAEKLIEEEFAFSLGISARAVGEYILSFTDSKAPLCP